MTEDQPFVLKIPVVRELEYLPYFPAHEAFRDHTFECSRCHVGAYHPKEVPEGEDPLCLVGEGLHDTVHDQIMAQRVIAMQQ